MADTTVIEPATATKEKPVEAPPATIPGTQVALAVIALAAIAVVWPTIPGWGWIAVVVVLAALAAWWLWRPGGRAAKTRRQRRDSRSPGLGRGRDSGRRGLFGRKNSAGRGPGGRGAGKSATGGRKGTAGNGQSAKQAAKAKKAADKAAAKAAKKQAAAQQRAAKKAAKADKKAAKKAAKTRGRDAMLTTGREPAVDLWDRKKKEDKPKKPEAAGKPPAPTPTKPTKNPPNRSTVMTSGDFTQPGAAANLISNQAAELRKFFADYNPKSLAAFSDDLPVTAAAVREQAGAFTTLAETVGRFKVNGAVAEQLLVAGKVLTKVAETIEATRNTLERTEAEVLDRQRNGDVEDRRADISRHQGEG